MSVGLRAGFATFGLLLLGFALGVGADHLWLAHRMHRAAPQEPTHQESFIAMLDTLNLTEEQHDAINEIFDRNHTNVRRHLAAVNAQLLPTMNSARLGIEAQLNPDQLAVFQAWMDVERERLDTIQHSVIRH